MSLTTFALQRAEMLWFFPLKAIMAVKLFVNAESWQLNGKKA